MADEMLNEATTEWNDTEIAAREAEERRHNISFLRKTGGEYAKRGRARGCSFRCEKVESVVSF